MTSFFSRVAMAATLVSGLAGTAFADAGHDHDASTAPAGTALPRFAAVSETFELVGVLDGKALTLYLDRFADNSPVKDAQLALEIDGVGVKTSPHGDGEFEGLLAQAPAAGVRSITATVVAGGASDRLAGALDLHEAAHADEAVPPRWRRLAMWALGAVAVAGLLAWALRRTTAARAARIGGAA